MQSLGLYIHIPFCASKCAYCDFYSFAADEALKDAYTEALCRELAAWGGLLGRPVDTVYLGGGTPTLIGGARLARLLETAARFFPLAADAEVTLEANPADDLGEVLRAARQAGVNRLSLGVQSGIPAELARLGRRHTLADVERTAAAAAAVGIHNLSLDLMLAIPGQTLETLESSVAFLTRLNPKHISAYLLKVEEGTPFAAHRESLALPDDDQAADLYLAAVDMLQSRGYRQYEISNFSRPGYESRHNLRYWNCREYLGLGPAAHSFVNGRRFYYPRTVQDYIAGKGASAGIWKGMGVFPTADAPVPPQDEGPGGDPAEYAMLRLRLTDGLDFALFCQKYGRPPADEFINRAQRYVQAGYMRQDKNKLRFTPSGFLLSNPILADLLERV